MLSSLKAEQSVFTEQHSHSLTQCKCKRCEGCEDGDDDDGIGVNNNYLYERNEAENSVDGTR